MTQELLQLLHQRKAAYRKWCSSHYSDNDMLLRFKRLRCRSMNLYRHLRNEYHYSACIRYQRSPKQLWNIVNSVTGRSAVKTPILIPAADLNIYFQQIKTDDTVSYFVPCGPPSADDLCEFTIVSCGTVERVLASLDVSKAPGPDGVLPSILKCCSKVLAPSLTEIFNRSLSTGIFPSAFKLANITPLVKSKDEDPLAASNHRGISLNSILSKVLERIVQDQLNTAFLNRDPLSDVQFGFRRQRSTVQLLAVALNDWMLARDKGLSTAVVFVDLSKAFDRVRHQEIIVALQAAGLSGTSLAWFASYLSDLRQRVVTTSGVSNFLPVSRGVPQGSILGPLLFNIYVSDIPGIIADINHTALLMYADDKTMYSSHQNINTAASMASSALENLDHILQSRGLSVNTDKTVAMFISPINRDDQAPSILLHGSPLKTVHSARCLGVIVSDDLTWSENINRLATKVGRKIGALRRVWRQLSPTSRRLFFLSVILPDLEYGAVAFLPSLSAQDRHRLERLFRRGIRAAAGVSAQSDVQPLLLDMSVPPLHARWLYHAGSFIYSSIKGHSPDCIANIFTAHSSSYSTRGQSAGSVVISTHKSKFGVNSLSNRFSLLWNAFPHDLKLCPTLPAFQSNLVTLLKDPQILSQYSNVLFGNVSSV